MDKINNNPDIDILGGDILTFEKFPNFKSGRKIPYVDKKFTQYMKLRNPINHSTVFFNRKKILELGGYPNARLGQDYLMWIVAVTQGYKLLNMNEVLVYMHVDSKSSRRRGLKNFKYDSYPYKLMFETGMVNRIEYIIGMCFRFTYCTFSSIRSIIGT
jgi:hypothetical protein